ncbi:MAG: hypothetical protein KGO93_02675 [Cyanobacteria bacterium REEB446]|nr:hypothetical protein [Cyanobacteria bacterium REEB446]
MMTFFLMICHKFSAYNRFLLFTIIFTQVYSASASLGVISLTESNSIFIDEALRVSIKERILSKKDATEDSKNPNQKKAPIKLATAPRIGPVTVKIDINPLNINRNQASLNLDIMESLDLLTHKKEFTYETIDFKRIKRYVSLDTVNSFVDTIKEEFSPVE